MESLSGATVSIFTPLPAIATTGAAGVETSEGLLWQGTTGSGGAVEGVLAPSFASIAHNWTAVISPMTEMVSLLVVATYSIPVGSGNQTAVYSYTNYLPYDPRQPPESFSTTVAFNLAQPSEVIVSPLASQGTTSVRTAGPCPPAITVWTTTYDQDFTGPFPILMVNDTGRTQSGVPYVDLAENFLQSQVSFGFTGAGAEESASGTTAYMTSNASWTSGVENLQIQGAGAAALAEAAYSFGMIYVPNVTLNVLHQNKTTTIYYPNGNGGCNSEIVVDQFVRLSILGVAGSEWDPEASSFPATYGQMLTELEVGQSGGAKTAANISVPSGHSYLWVNMTAQAGGYSTVSDLEQQVTSALSVFDTALGVGLAIMDAADACGFLCSAGDIAETLVLTDTALGVALEVVGLVSSVSFSTTVQENYHIVTLTSDNGAFYDQILEAPSTTTLTTTNGTASANMPLDVVGWPT